MRKMIFVITVLLGAFLLSACSGGPVHGTTWPGLSTDGSLIYYADGPTVYAVSVGDGREVWRYPAEPDNNLIFYATPAVAPDGTVIIGSAGRDHRLIALKPNDIDAETNAPFEAWTFTGARDYWMAPPLILENKLFGVNADGNLYVLDLQDGRSSKEATVVELDGGRLWSQPTTDGERVYLTSLDHHVIAVDANTNEIVWRENLGGAVAGSAVLSENGSLYVGSLTSQLEKFDSATGDHQPVVDAENWVWSTPSLDGDTMYFGDVSGNLYSFNTSTDSLNWNPVKPENSEDASITASPLVREDYILVASESGKVFAVDREGKTLWQQEIGGQIFTTPIAVGDLTIVAPLQTDFYLVALDPNGRQVWTFTPEN